jgi:hypothetical protein
MPWRLVLHRRTSRHQARLEAAAEHSEAEAVPAVSRGTRARELYWHMPPHLTTLIFPSAATF